MVHSSGKRRRTYPNEDAPLCQGAAWRPLAPTGKGTISPRVKDIRQGNFTTTPEAE